MEREEELRSPVNRWMISKGLRPLNEIMICWRMPDVVGLEENRIRMAVEMKLSDWRGALRQARTCTIFAQQCYVAMPCPKLRILLRNIREFNLAGIGILIIHEDGEVSEVLKSDLFPAPFSHL